ncbi:Uncharacterized protein OBRU01_07656 [Operophtera brumata]|uniref:Uncharacterized protein n=1 Tax=Operophtera brumata TaxID=104452 RepID=A0A0L7LJ23_OPEBR|nr:Uncharacterized protein OBRU01_07656 [Operophtera brumata]
MLVMIASMISPSIQLTPDQATFNVSALNGSQKLYFDKISDLQFIKDEWKLVVYYNMTTYWHGVSNISNYINHIKNLSKGEKAQYQNIVSQLEHEMEEVEHYNKLLLAQNIRRQRRGLINGIGYVANSLFGVLDDRFAEQYKQDVEKIANNENHLQDLIKNQTSVLESEYNILKRNEKAMAQQFKFIKDQIHNISLSENRIQYDSEIGFYITSSALTANIILSNLRRMQQTLISTVTDISQGQIDPHLLLPEEMENQMNIISGQLKGDLMLPFDRHNIKGHQILLPITNRALHSIQLKKGYASFLSENDLQHCTHAPNEKILCILQLPIYDLQLKQSLCSIKLLSTSSDSICKTIVATCQDRWIKLHRPNDWLYACCAECHVRIQCPAGITIKQLTGTGVITLGDECKLRGSGYTIYTNNNFLTKVNIESKFETPELSVLNKIIDTSATASALSSGESFDPTAEMDWDELISQIKLLKEQSSYQLNVHDVHHYVMVYVILCITVVGAIIAIGWRWRRNRSLAMARHEPAVSYETEAAAPQPRPRANSVSAVHVHSEQVLRACEPECSVKGVSTGTSPIVIKSKLYQ